MNRNCRKAFTLTEMLVVIAIISLFVVLAVPTVRVLTGSRSIGSAQNALAAVLTKAREEAIAMQDYCGVYFHLDPFSDRVICFLVQRAAVQDTTGIANFVPLDLMTSATQGGGGGMESIALPSGVRLQTITNGMSMTATPLQVQYSSGQEQTDRYLGFNPDVGNTYNNFGASAGTSTIGMIGGVVLFDSRGRLTSQPYGLQFVSVGTNGSTIMSGFYNLLMDASPPSAPAYGANAPSGVFGQWATTGTNGSCVYLPGYHGGNFPPTAPELSQIGLVLFDRDAFITAGFNDTDVDINALTAYQTPNANSIQSEQAEEAWLDQNAVPLLINRYDGTLIKSE